MSKKLIKKTLFAAAFCSYSFMSAENFVYSIDSLKIMQESKEGLALISEFEKERDSAIKTLKALEEDLKSQQALLEKQAPLLKAEALKEKTLELQTKEKKITRERDQIAEDLNAKFQVKQEKLFASQLESAKKVFETKSKNGDGVLIDIRAPGVLAVGKNTDVTAEVLVAVNTKWDTEQKKSISKQAAAAAA